MDYKERNYVLSYNNDSSKRTAYYAAPGTKIEWKRNGSRGGVKAVVIGYSEEKPLYVFVENWRPDWSQPIARRVWIKKKSILHVFDK